MEAFAEWLVDFVHGFGYFGIFIMTFLESTFAPIPAELTMVPAGYLVYQGKMDGILVMLIAIIGTICGSLANYYVALYFGRRFLYAYGKYMFFDHDKMEKLDKFFASHGEISTLTGRLIPGLRHVISFPAGLARMHIKKFIIYTSIGGAIWMGILIMVGYFIGGNKALVKQYMPYIIAAAIVAACSMLLIYTVRHNRKNAGKI